MNVPDIFELVNMCLYDTVHIREVPVKHPYFLFQAPVGILDPNETLPGADWKTFLRTSQVLCGMNPTPIRFTATRLNALFIENDRPLRIWETDLYCKTEITFEIAQKRYWQGPAWQCASPFALFGAPKIEIARLYTDYGVEWERVGGNLGVCHIEKPFDVKDYKFGETRREYYEGITIEAQNCFHVRAAVYDMGPRTNLQLAVHIDGTTARPII